MCFLLETRLRSLRSTDGNVGEQHASAVRTMDDFNEKFDSSGNKIKYVTDDTPNLTERRRSNSGKNIMTYVTFTTVICKI